MKLKLAEYRSCLYPLAKNFLAIWTKPVSRNHGDLPAPGTFPRAVSFSPRRLVESSPKSSGLYRIFPLPRHQATILSRQGADMKLEQTIDRSSFTKHSVSS